MKLHTSSRIAVTGSKGNQDKWLRDGRWYKLDSAGYEGLAEAVCSALLAKTNLPELGFRFVSYRVEHVEAHGRPRVGCSSADFRSEDESIRTLADLLRLGVGEDWRTQAERERSIRERIRWIVERTVELTGLSDFGAYLTALFEADMLFANEDRHMNNIAVIRRGEAFDYCPMFDFGAGLLSNVRDYPMDVEPRGLLGSVRARPMECGFTRQVHAAQELYGAQLRCDFADADVRGALEAALPFYAKRDAPYIRDRVIYCIMTQRKKLFGSR